MIKRDVPGGLTNPDGVPRLAEIADDLARKLIAGEAFDPESLVAEHPDHADRLRALLPTMHHLVELGRLVARERQVGPRSDPLNPLS